MKNAKWLRFFTAALFWLGLWELAAWRLSLTVPQARLLLPPPTEVFPRLVELGCTLPFWQTVLGSLGRVAAAFAVGAVLGCLCALLCALSPVLSALTTPLMVVVRATPVASFILLLLLWLPGAGWVSFAAAMLMTAPIFWSNLGRAAESADPRLLEMARAYHLSRGQVFRHIYLPALRGALLSACESGVGLAWKAGVAAEVLTRPALAIGKMIYESKLYLETTDLFAWTAAVVLMSLAVEKGVQTLVKKGARSDES
ncbi:MAG: ABC transporter permease [Candidatus Heteroscillospira sp.]|jgi:NitT/TauT family transport system permease protein